jgi:hypothetical protein
MVNRHQAGVIVSHSEPQSAMHIWTREPTIGFPRDVGSGGKYLSIKLDRLPLFCSVFTLVKTANKGQDTGDVHTPSHRDKDKDKRNSAEPAFLWFPAVIVLLFLEGSAGHFWCVERGEVLPRDIRERAG